MSFAVDTIVANTRRVYPDLSAALAVDLLNQVRRDLFRRFKLRQASQSIDLTAAQQEYAYSADFLNIESVHFVTSSSATSLEPVEFSYLNKYEKEWRSTSAGTPSRFYLSVDSSGPKIGLDPKPSTTTSSGSPVIVLRGTQVDTVSAGGTIYDDIPNSLPYEHGICWLFARAERIEDAEYFRFLYKDALSEVGSYLLSKNHHAPEEQLAETAKTYSESE